MRRRIFVLPFLGFMFLSIVVFSQNADITIDYQSLVAANGSTAEVPVGYGFDNYGPYTVHNKIWVFYPDGADVVWQTKQIEEGGQWSTKNVFYSDNSSPSFNMAFDGRFFHFIRGVAGDLIYQRGEARPDGSIIFNDPVVAYSDPVWRVSGDIARHFAITVDSEKRLWAVVQVSDGDEPLDNYKIIAIASVATNGTWQNRSGFPFDLIEPFGNRATARAPSVAEIAPGQILYIWSNYRPNQFDPLRGFLSRLWNNGAFGEIEITGLLYQSTSSSIVVPQQGIAMVNSQSQVARRNADGSWVRVDPGSMENSNFNVLTIKNGAVRLWDFSNQNIRYRETLDNGASWYPLTTKWLANLNVFNMSGTPSPDNQGSYHSLLFSTGSSPYNIFIGIEGTFPSPIPPVLVSPADSTGDLIGDIILVWNPIEGIQTYQLQVARDVNFSQIILDENIQSENSKTITLSEEIAKYFWRVRAITDGGTMSNWSEVWMFSTQGLPNAPVLILPANGASNQPTSVRFSWNAVLGADYYRLQIATSSDFSATFMDVDNIQDTTTLVSGFDFDRTYYWRLRASNDFGNSEWSQVWSFATAIAAPQPPVLVSPEDESKDVLTSLQISWQESPTATSYRLQVSKQSNFSSTVVNVGNITGTTYDASGLEHSTAYYWRVNASNESGTGNWSEVWNFTTIIAIPDPPVLLSPVIGSESVSTFPVIRWDVSTRAESYRLQVARDNMFSTVVFDQSDIDSTQYTFVEELNEFTRYYWRVNAKNIGGISEWSSISHFTTDQAVPVAPVLVGPDDGTTNVTNAMMLWNAVPTATGYRLQVSKNADFSSPAVDRDDLTNTFFQATNLEKFTTYYWRVRGISRVGQGYWSEVRSYETGDIVSVEMIDHQIPDEFALGQNFPNPFNPVTSIQFALPTDAIVQLEVYNMLGQRIATLIDGEYHNAGTYQAMWDARDDAGREISSGIYIYRITAGDFIETKKMTLMK